MTATGFVSQLLQLAIALLLAPLLLGWVNQCRAWLSNRSAPSLLLPYRTIRKLFHKDAVVAENASAVFRITPYIVFSAMALAAARSCPRSATDLPFDCRPLMRSRWSACFALARVVHGARGDGPRHRVRHAWARGARCSSASWPSRRCSWCCSPPR